jgi:hypothetical protein
MGRANREIPTGFPRARHGRTSVSVALAEKLRGNGRRAKKRARVAGAVNAGIQIWLKNSADRDVTVESICPDSAVGRYYVATRSRRAKAKNQKISGMFFGDAIELTINDIHYGTRGSPFID